jgi:transposase-like protein
MHGTGDCIALEMTETGDEPFSAYPVEVRRIICTTSALASVHSLLRTLINHRGHFPSDEAAAKLICLTLRITTAKWTMPP